MRTTPQTQDSVIVRYWFSVASAAKAVGLGTRQFRRLAEELGIIPIIFERSKGPKGRGPNKQFFTRPQLQLIRNHRQCAAATTD